MYEGDVKMLATFIHQEYEKFSKKYGWETNETCKVEFDDLPEANRETMMSVSDSILRKFQHSSGFEKKQVGIGIKDSDGNEIREGDLILYRKDSDSDWECAVIRYFGKEDYPAFDLYPRKDWESNAISTLIGEGYEIHIKGEGITYRE